MFINAFEKYSAEPLPREADPLSREADPHPPGSRLRHTVNERPVRILLECILVFINAFEKYSAEPLLKSILKLVTLHIVKLCGSPNIPNFLDFMRALEIFTKTNIVIPCRRPFGESWIHPCIVYV